MVKRDAAIPRPPAGAARHRRWRVWYEFGVLEAGACVLETAWYAKAPGGDVIYAAGWNDVLAGIDEIEDARGGEQGDRLTPIVHAPPRERGSYHFWMPDERRNS